MRELREKGYSIREISQIVGKSISTVCRWLKEEKEEKNPKLFWYVKRLEETGLYEKLIELLLYKVKEKGQERYLPLAKVYHALQLELEMNGISVSYHRFRQIVKAIVVGVLGKKWEEFINKRRSAGSSKRLSLKPVERRGEVLEIDLTGYEFGGKNYSLLLGFDLYTGFLFPPFIVENKEKGGVGHYNKAFNSMEVALYLIEVFKKAGVPKAVKCDNEKILKSRLIKEGLQKLGVKLLNTHPYRPNEKIIEVVIKEFKSYLRLHRKEAKSIEELTQLAVESYNRNYHRFKHLSERVIPAELFKGYSRKVEETIISTAFVETLERTLKDGQIQIDNLIYQISYPKKREKVVVKRLITNLREVMVYQKSSGEFIGVARLFSEPPKGIETTVEFRQEKLRSKRIDRRKKKLEGELKQLKQETPSLKVEELFSEGEVEKPVIVTELSKPLPLEEEEGQPKGLTLEEI